jgi:hypothetical protein
VLPQFLLSLFGSIASLFGPHPATLEQAVTGLYGVTLIGIYFTGPVLLALGLPLYLVARRRGVATPLLGAGIGAVLGLLLLWFTSEHFREAIVVGVVLGIINGFVFVQVAGRSPSRNALTP